MTLHISQMAYIPSTFATFRSPTLQTSFTTSVKPPPTPISRHTPLRNVIRISHPVKASADSPEPPLSPTINNPTSEKSLSPKSEDDKHTSKADELRQDLIATLGWVGLAGGFALGILQMKGVEASLQFVTAYIVEYSLSVDNLFVFLLLFRYFRVTRQAQSRVLTYGIAGAVFFRLIMIVTGEALTQKFSGVSLAFAAILIFSAVKILVSGDAEEDDDVGESGIVKFASSLLPFSDSFDGDRFFTKVSGKQVATPLMLVLLSVEFSDVIFALDSVPAVLGISKDTLIIYLSNILAIAGLRNLFFLLADSIEGLRFLPQSLAIVLGFVGSKMVASVFGYEVGIIQSLSIVISALGGGVGLSLLFPEQQDDAESDASK